MKLTDPDFTFPSGKTLAEMEEFHRQWELDHAEPADHRVRPSAPVTTAPRTRCPVCDEELPAYTLAVHSSLRHPA